MPRPVSPMMATAIQSTGCARRPRLRAKPPPCEYQVETEERDQQQEHVGAERRQWDRSQEITVMPMAYTRPARM